MECRVEFDYVAQEPDELTIKKGEIIKNVVTKMDGWFEGTLNGKTGVFPDNFVKVMEKPVEIPEKTAKPSEVVVLRNNPNSARRVKVLFSYAPEQEDELSLEVGDVLDFIEEVEEGWWRGKLRGKEGIFPSNFVQEVEGLKTNGSLDNGKPEDVPRKDISRNSLSKVGIGIPDVVPDPPTHSIDEPAPELPPKPVRELARCFYPYNAGNEDELSLAEGDIITIISRQCEDEGWWRGELRGKIGLFPDNFVKIITPGEVQPIGNSNGPQPKLLAQERNVPHAAVPPSDLSFSKAKKDSIPNSGTGTTVVDGGGVSKSADKESKVELTKAKLNKSLSKEQPQLPIAPKVGHVATSPIAPGIAAFHTNLFSNQKPDTFLRRDTQPGSKDDKSDESEEFNSVERTETLNHLTATRAKAPKRRPPSAVVTRENETTMINGSSHSYDSSLADSPPPLNHNSTPNSSVTSNGTHSGSFLDHSGSFLSSKDGREKESSPTPSNAANNTSASNKPKKQAPPWMAELKQTQDKKRGLVSPGAGPAPTIPSGSPASATPNLPVTTPPPTQTPPQANATPKEPPASAKAPPLPAKPSSFSAGPPATPEKTYNNLNHSSSFNKSFTKKSPSPAPPVPIVPSNHNSSVSSTDGGHRGDGDGNSNKGYVTYEEHAALKTRLTSLENEVETLKRQIKLLMDRDLRGHIV